MDAQIIGHRGASHDAPENTRAAFQLAWEQGADGVELDVRLTQDGRVVVIHDDTAFRTAGADLDISRATYSRLRVLDAGSWKSPVWSGERIPELGDVLADVPPGLKVFVEIKCGMEIMAPLREVMESAPVTMQQLAVVGFDREVMRLARQQLPVREVLWNVELKTAEGHPSWKPGIDELGRQTQDAGLDGLGIGVRGKVDRAFVRAALERNLRLFAWTVDDPLVAEELIELGVQYIVTNRPGWMRLSLGLRLKKER